LFTGVSFRDTSSYASPDGRTIQFITALKAGDPTTAAGVNAIPAVREQAARVAGTLGASAWGVAGQAAVGYDINSMSDSDLLRVIPLAIVVIGLLLALVMRSLVSPLYLIASVALSYLATLGVAVLLFMKAGGQAGLTFFLSLLMFIFLLALGEDYNILVMTRIREEAQRLPLKEAVARALTATGSTVTSAGLVLGGTFAVFAMVGGKSMGRPGRRVRPGDRHTPRHVRGPHPARAFRGRLARQVELVAIKAQPFHPRPARRGN
jgi:RND superfamily putative drug exporter